MMRDVMDLLASTPSIVENRSIRFDIDTPLILKTLRERIPLPTAFQTGSLCKMSHSLKSEGIQIKPKQGGSVNSALKLYSRQEGE